MRIARLVLASALLAATVWLMMLERPDPAPAATDWRAEFASPPPAGEMRVLFVGNSFTARNDLPGMVAGLLTEGGVAERVRTRMVAAGGAQLEEHAASEELRGDIAGLTWHKVILQDFSTAPLFEAEGPRSAEAIAELSALARQSGAESVLFATWARAEGHSLYEQSFDGFLAPDGPGEMTDIVERHYRKVGAETGARVAPVGRMWLTASTVLPEIEIYAEDGYHASPAGTYLTALVIARTLGLDPAATDWAPKGVNPGDAGQLRMLVASADG